MQISSALVIGGGSIGKRHLQNLTTLGVPRVAMVEPNPERAAANAQEFGVTVFSSIAEAYAQHKWQIALVCSPSAFHLEQALACAEQGSHLFIEKPIALTLDGLEKLESLVHEKKLITMVGSNWKFHPSFLKMKSLLAAGKIGQIISVRCEFGSYLPDWHPWEDHRSGYSANKKLGGGVLLDSHELDYVPWLVGGQVQRLACFADRVSDITVDTEDVAEVLLQFDSGAIAEIHQDYVQRFPNRAFEFFGKLGTITWDLKTKTVELRVAGANAESYTLESDYDSNTMYVEQLRHLLQCIENAEPTVTPLAVGRKTLELILAAKESSAANKIIQF